MLLAAVSTVATAAAACLSFAPPPQGSACSAGSAEFRWLNPPAVREADQRPGRSWYDDAVGDPAFQSGVKVSGKLEFDFRARGPHLVELLIRNPEADRYSFRLAVNGTTVDERPLIAPGPGRMRPKRGARYTTLLGLVHGPAKISIAGEAPQYVLSAARWTPADRFETETVPRYLERARYLRTHILLEADQQRPTARRHYLQQLGDRLAFSTRPEVRRDALLDRTRAWFWLAMENHEPDDILQTTRLFEEGLRLMPADPILRQMISASCLGQVVKGRSPTGGFCDSVAPVRWTVDVPPPPAGAPEWAVTQRQLMRRLDALTRWWVEKRQAANGELGGDWGDDVEILRHWGPQALGFGSAVAARGILAEAKGLWNSGTLLHGYDRAMSDVEHSSEPTTDTQPLAAAIEPTGEARDRLATTAACSEYWIQKQPDGRYRFRSTWFNCREADTSPDRAVDVHLNTRALGPALWYAYLSRDAKLVERIAHWADAWIVAMRSTNAGKPAGIFPPVVRSADGSYRIGSDRWDKPNAEWDYFQWSGGSQEALTSLVLAAYDLTGDPNYLDAATDSFAALRNCQAHRELCEAIRSAPEAFYAWRTASGNAAFDKFFGYSPDEDDRAALAAMTKMARECDQRYSANWDIYTTEVLYTDRVYYPLPPEYRWRLFGGEAPRGDRYPTFAVTWPAVNLEVARAVLAVTPRQLRLRLYSFEKAEARVAVRLWRLKPGRYEWRAQGRREEFTVTRLPHDLSLPVPPATEQTVVIQTAR